MPAAVWLGVALVALALALGVLALAGPRRAQVPLSRLTSAPSAAPATGLASAAEGTTARVDQLLQRSGRLDTLEAALERGGMRQRPAEVVVITGGAALGLGAVCLLAGGPLLGLVGAALAPLGAYVVVTRAIRRRQAAFLDQLDDALQLMAGSLRAGHSVLRALDTVSHDTQAPIAEEFSRVVNETRVGRDLNAALEEVVERTQSDDFAWVVQAIAIHREVGGNLAEVLDRVSGTIRERGQLRRQARALSAEGRISGIVLLVLPFAITGVLLLVSPDYVGRLTASSGGLTALALAGVLMVVGAVWIRKTVEVDY
ncbi:type II secretion system protein F [Modestobacter sp. I12A-02628]|uniref:Type II secretion system protein F n=1 Tax=Goekera deserti TaxID=2497753 RepID=A0A7K3WAS8_9ACTN|nr:type II secretion system F family protein [Goekera deserti]MPQ97583.1 type II secretion system protein F [Goekera deserti]NDI47813.1 type II secretion system protein F [Goekera deserti]NEL53561.1 type II secretion system protein F [Goekera deserti]